MPAARVILVLLSLGTLLAVAGCRRPPGAQRGGEKHELGRPIYASWYNVPSDSRARRRAGPAELTAARDRLEPGTLVNVTRVSNGKSVVVRVTDRGLHSKKARLDVCKEAAEQLDMVSDGLVQVRTEVLPPQL